MWRALPVGIGRAPLALGSKSPPLALGGKSAPGLSDAEVAHAADLFFGVNAVLLFVLMGVILEKSRIAEDLLETMGRLFGRMNGGLGVSVVLVGALLAASTGIVGATVVAAMAA